LKPQIYSFYGSIQTIYIEANQFSISHSNKLPKEFYILLLSLPLSIWSRRKILENFSSYPFNFVNPPIKFDELAENIHRNFVSGGIHEMRF